jgi:hypothetical protein
MLQTCHAQVLPRNRGPVQVFTIFRSRTAVTRHCQNEVNTCTGPLFRLILTALGPTPVVPWFKPRPLLRITSNELPYLSKEYGKQ